MKNISFTLCFIFFAAISSAQWTKKLILPGTETFSFISAVNDRLVWGLNRNKEIYITTNAGNNWIKIIPSGIADNTTSKAFYAVTDAIAFLAVNTDLTGIGPGILYAT